MIQGGINNVRTTITIMIDPMYLPIGSYAGFSLPELTRKLINDITIGMNTKTQYQCFCMNAANTKTIKIKSIITSAYAPNLLVVDNFRAMIPSVTSASTAKMNTEKATTLDQL